MLGSRNHSTGEGKEKPGLVLGSKGGETKLCKAVQNAIWPWLRPRPQPSVPGMTSSSITRSAEKYQGLVILPCFCDSFRIDHYECRVQWQGCECGHCRCEYQWATSGLPSPSQATFPAHAPGTIFIIFPLLTRLSLPSTPLPSSMFSSIFLRYTVAINFWRLKSCIAVCLAPHRPFILFSRYCGWAPRLSCSKTSVREFSRDATSGQCIMICCTARL